MTYKDYFKLGKNYYLRESYKKALKYLLKAKELQPENIDNLTYLADTYSVLEKDKKSLEINFQILKLQPKNIRTIASISYDYWNLTENSKSIEFALKALTIDSKNKYEYVTKSKNFYKFVKYNFKTFLKIFNSNKKNRKELIADIESFIKDNNNKETCNYDEAKSIYLTVYPLITDGEKKLQNIKLKKK